MKRIIALLFAAHLVALAQEAPSTDFKGFYVGTKIDEAKFANDFKGKCKKTTCVGETTIAGTPARVGMALGLDGLINRIQVNFAPSSWAAVTEALSAKFGPAAATTDSQVQNGFGATAKQTHMVWHRPDGATIMARERADSLTEAEVTFLSARELSLIEFNRKNNIGDL